MIYLSYGGGVGSTALLLTKLSQIESGKIEPVFINHGADWPETYEYIKYIQDTLKIKITQIKANIERKGDLFQYFWHYKISINT